MYKKYLYYPLALFMGCGVVERHLEMAKPTKKLGCLLLSLKLCNFELLQIKYCSSEALVCLWCDVNGITYYRLIHPSFIKLNSNRIQLFSLYSVTTKIEIKRLKSTKYFIPVVLLHFFYNPHCQTYIVAHGPLPQPTTCRSPSYNLSTVRKQAKVNISSSKIACKC